MHRDENSCNLRSIFSLQFKMLRVSIARQMRTKHLLSNKRLSKIRDNNKNYVSNRQATKQHQLLCHRRQKLRAIRHNHLCRHGKVQSTRATYSPPVLRLRSKLDFQGSLNANLIINLQLLLDGFRECSNVTPQNKMITQKCVTLHLNYITRFCAPLTVQSKHKVSIAFMVNFIFLFYHVAMFQSR